MSTDVTSNASATREELSDARLDGMRRELLGPYATAVGQNPGPVATAFCAALTSLSAVRLITSSDEETTTSALLGAMITGFRAAKHILPVATYPTPRFCWAGYRKGRTRLVWESEAQRGADFALVVWTSKSSARIALFQAKRMEETEPALPLLVSSPSSPKGRLLTLPSTPLDGQIQESPVRFKKGAYYLNVHRRPPQRDTPVDAWRRAQMKQLRDTAGKISLALTLSKPGEAGYELFNSMQMELPGCSSASSATSADGVGVGTEPKQGDARKTRGEADRDFRAMVNRAYRSLPDDKPEEEDAFNAADLHWIHYLAYPRGPLIPSSENLAEDAAGEAREERPSIVEMNETFDSAADETELSSAPTSEAAICVPLLGLWPWFTVEREMQASRKNILDLCDVWCYRFADVLLAGVSPGEGSRDGWLELDGALVRALLPAMQDVCEVLMADEHGGIAHTFGNDPGGSPTPPLEVPGNDDPSGGGGTATALDPSSEIRSLPPLPRGLSIAEWRERREGPTAIDDAPPGWKKPPTV